MFALVFGFAAFHAAIAVSAAWLGHFGILRPGFFILASIVIGLSLLFWLRGELASPRSSEPAAPRDTALRRASAVLWTVTLVLLAGFLIAGLVRFWAAPPGALNYDDTHYHLTAAATWIAHGDLRMVKFPVGDGSPAFYPIGSELFSFFLLCLTAPSDILARFSELPFAVLSLAAVYLLARRLDLSREGSLAAAALSALTPKAFPEKMLSAGNDHATAFYLVASLLASLHFVEAPGKKRGVLLGLAAGLLVGTKYSGVMFLPLVVAVLVLRLWETRESQVSRPTLAASLLLAVAAAAAAGGYTYLRNWVTAENPLFPATVRFAGHTLLQGWRSLDRATLAQSPEFAIEPVRFLLARPDLWGAHFAFLLLPAALLAPAFALFRGRERRFSDLAILLTPIYLYLVYVRLMPDHREIRYIFAAPLVAAISVAFVLERGFRARRPHVGAALLAVSALLLGARAFTVASRSQPAPGGRFDSAAAAQFIEKTVAGKPVRIALAGTNQPYLFFGSRLQNSVSYVPTHEAAGAEFYSWGSPLDFPHRSIDPGKKSRADIFWRNLVDRRIQGVVIARTGDEYPVAGWVALDSARFEKIFSGEKQEVYLVKNPPAGHAVPFPFVTVDDGIPGSVDEPVEGAVIRGDLKIQGWCLERGGGEVRVVEARLDGESLDLGSLVRVPRDDVAAAIPDMGDASRAGFELVIPAKSLPMGRVKLVVAFGTADLRVRYTPAVTLQIEGPASR